jgi:outer membrane protein assembly factor BamB
MLWYGEPGPQKRIDRHAAPPMPLVSGGIMFTIGYDLVMAHDVYNGRLIWERQILGATRQHLPVNTSNLAADDHSLFVVIDGGRCLRLSAATGETLASYRLPAISDDQPDASGDTWAWIAVDGPWLFGSRAEFDADRRRASEQTSDLVFALSKETGRLGWTYAGSGIDHDGIAVADSSLFLVDRNLTDTEREAARATRMEDDAVPDRPTVDRRGKPIPPDLRKLVALDAETGDQQWTRPLNLTDVTLDDMVVQGRGGVACMAKDGVVVVHGTGSLGHPHKEFLGGEFDRRALYAFASGGGLPLWGGRKGYRKRPIIVGNHIYAEPFAWNLHTGEQKTIANPLSGKNQTLDFHRGYIGCGHLLASAQTLFGAKEGIGYWNLDDVSGFRPFDGVDLACGLGAVPAAGVFVAPEGRSGCTCDVPIHTSLALYPKPGADDWSLGFAGGRAPAFPLPVQNVSINLGAPGYRQDEAGNLWIPYPARVESGILGDWLPTYQHDRQMCFRLNEVMAPIEGTDVPWVYQSGYRHDKPLRFRLLEPGQAPCRYTVSLLFAEPENLTAGQRIFSVQLQGATVLENFDIVRAAGGPRRAIVREFPDIKVDGELEIHLLPAEASNVRQPVLCGFQAIRQ